MLRQSLYRVNILYFIVKHKVMSVQEYTHSLQAVS